MSVKKTEQTETMVTTGTLGIFPGEIGRMGFAYTTKLPKMWSKNG